MEHTASGSLMAVWVWSRQAGADSSNTCDRVRHGLTTLMALAPPRASLDAATAVCP
jgi:hypothetical protein